MNRRLGVAVAVAAVVSSVGYFFLIGSSSSVADLLSSTGIVDVDAAYLSRPVKPSPTAPAPHQNQEPAPAAGEPAADWRSNDGIALQWDRLPDDGSMVLQCNLDTGLTWDADGRMVSLEAEEEASSSAGCDAAGSAAYREFSEVPLGHTLKSMQHDVSRRQFSIARRRAVAAALADVDAAYSAAQQHSFCEGRGGGIPGEGGEGQQQRATAAPGVFPSSESGRDATLFDSRVPLSDPADRLAVHRWPMDALLPLPALVAAGRSPAHALLSPRAATQWVRSPAAPGSPLSAQFNAIAAASGATPHRFMGLTDLDRGGNRSYLVGDPDLLLPHVHVAACGHGADSGGGMGPAHRRRRLEGSWGAPAGPSGPVYQEGADAEAGELGDGGSDGLDGDASAAGPDPPWYQPWLSPLFSFRITAPSVQALSPPELTTLRAAVARRCRSMSGEARARRWEGLTSLGALLIDSGCGVEADLPRVVREAEAVRVAAATAAGAPRARRAAAAAAADASAGEEGGEGDYSGLANAGTDDIFGTSAAAVAEDAEGEAVDAPDAGEDIDYAPDDAAAAAAAGDSSGDGVVALEAAGDADSPSAAGDTPPPNTAGSTADVEADEPANDGSSRGWPKPGGMAPCMGCEAAAAANGATAAPPGCAPSSQRAWARFSLRRWVVGGSGRLPHPLLDVIAEAEAAGGEGEGGVPCEAGSARGNRLEAGPGGSPPVPVVVQPPRAPPPPAAARPRPLRGLQQQGGERLPSARVPAAPRFLPMVVLSSLTIDVAHSDAASVAHIGAAAAGEPSPDPRGPPALTEDTIVGLLGVVRSSMTAPDIAALARVSAEDSSSNNSSSSGGNSSAAEDAILSSARVVAGLERRLRSLRSVGAYSGTPLPWWGQDERFSLHVGAGAAAAGGLHADHAVTLPAAVAASLRSAAMRPPQGPQLPGEGAEGSGDVYGGHAELRACSVWGALRGLGTFGQAVAPWGLLSSHSGGDARALLRRLLRPGEAAEGGSRGAAGTQGAAGRPPRSGGALASVLSTLSRTCAAPLLRELGSRRLRLVADEAALEKHAENMETSNDEVTPLQVPGGEGNDAPTAPRPDPVPLLPARGSSLLDWVRLSDASLPLPVALPLSLADAPWKPWRGLSVDTARHFLPLPSLLHTLDAMGAAGLSVLHWHLSDAQSWPLELEGLPELAEYGSWEARDPQPQPPGAPPRLRRVYTRVDASTLVHAAALRGIRVVPEVDGPAHARSLSRAPALSSVIVPCHGVAGGDADLHGSDKYALNPSVPSTYAMLGLLLAELGQIFPDAHLHVGADEVVEECWSRQHGAQLAAWVEAHLPSLAWALGANTQAAGVGGWRSRFPNNFRPTYFALLAHYLHTTHGLLGVLGKRGASWADSHEMLAGAAKRLITSSHSSTATASTTPASLSLSPAATTSRSASRAPASLSSSRSASRGPGSSLLLTPTAAASAAPSGSGSGGNSSSGDGAIVTAQATAAGNASGASPSSSSSGAAPSSGTITASAPSTTASEIAVPVPTTAIGTSSPSPSGSTSSGGGDNGATMNTTASPLPSVEEPQIPRRLQQQGGVRRGGTPRPATAPPPARWPFVSLLGGSGSAPHPMPPPFVSLLEKGPEEGDSAPAPRSLVLGPGGGIDAGVRPSAVAAALSLVAHEARRRLQVTRGRGAEGDPATAAPTTGLAAPRGRGLSEGPGPLGTEQEFVGLLDAGGRGGGSPLLALAYPASTSVEAWKCWEEHGDSGLLAAAGDGVAAPPPRNGTNTSSSPQHRFVFNAACWYLDYNEGWQEYAKHWALPETAGGMEALRALTQRHLAPGRGPSAPPPSWESVLFSPWPYAGGEAAIWTEAIDGSSLLARAWPRAAIVADSLASQSLALHKAAVGMGEEVRERRERGRAPGGGDSTRFEDTAKWVPHAATWRHGPITSTHQVTALRALGFTRSLWAAGINAAPLVLFDLRPPPTGGGGDRAPAPPPSLQRLWEAEEQLLAARSGVAGRGPSSGRSPIHPMGPVSETEKLLPFNAMVPGIAQAVQRLPGNIPTGPALQAAPQACELTTGPDAAEPPASSPPLNPSRRLRFAVWNIANGGARRRRHLQGEGSGRGGRALQPSGPRFERLLRWLLAHASAFDVVALVEAVGWDESYSGRALASGGGGNTSRHLGEGTRPVPVPGPPPAFLKEASDGLRRRAGAAGYPFSHLLLTASGFHITLLSSAPIAVVGGDAGARFQRGFLVAETHGVRWMIAHLHAHDPRVRREEAAWLAHLGTTYAAAGIPSVLAGDLNSLSPLDARCHAEMGVAAWLASPGVPEYLRRKFCVAQGDGALGEGGRLLRSTGAQAAPQLDYRPIAALLDPAYQADDPAVATVPAVGGGSLLPPFLGPFRDALWPPAARGGEGGGAVNCSAFGSVPTSFAVDDVGTGEPPMRIDQVFVNSAMGRAWQGAGGGGGAAQLATPAPPCRILNGEPGVALLSDHFPLVCEWQQAALL